MADSEGDVPRNTLIWIVAAVIIGIAILVVSQVILGSIQSGGESLLNRYVAHSLS